MKGSNTSILVPTDQCLIEAREIEVGTFNDRPNRLLLCLIQETVIGRDHFILVGAGESNHCLNPQPNCERSFVYNLYYNRSGGQGPDQNKNFCVGRNLNKQCQVLGQTIGRYIYLSIKAKNMKARCICT
jgi:hypothetical protein